MHGIIERGIRPIADTNEHISYKKDRMPAQKKDALFTKEGCLIYELSVRGMLFRMERAYPRKKKNTSDKSSRKGGRTLQKINLKISIHFKTFIKEQIIDFGREESVEYAKRISKNYE